MLVDSLKGSSPRMRGARILRIVQMQMNGIIPADAGSTRRHRKEMNFAADHPRGCGEHASLSQGSAPLAGSSPRMRGAPVSVGPRGYHTRIIPADAGSTVQKAVEIILIVDHPRGCGEHPVRSVAIISISGSSPRMRGAHRR